MLPNLQVRHRVPPRAEALRPGSHAPLEKGAQPAGAGVPGGVFRMVQAGEDGGDDDKLRRKGKDASRGGRRRAGGERWVCWELLEEIMDTECETAEE